MAGSKLKLVNKRTYWLLNTELSELIGKKRVICIRPAMPQEKKTERERRKYLKPKKYEVFKKNKAARIREYRLKKNKWYQSNYRSAMQHQPQKHNHPSLQHFQHNKFWAKVFTRLKNHSHPVSKRRPRCLAEVVQSTYSCT